MHVRHKIIPGEEELTLRKTSQLKERRVLVAYLVRVSVLPRVRGHGHDRSSGTADR